MTAAQHHDGPVMHDTRGYPHADVSAIDGKRGIAVTWGIQRRQPKTKEAYERRTAEARANARRIVACWNYCLGLSTEEMEASVARGDEWEPQP